MAAIEDAFRQVKRADFVPAEMRDQAGLDMPLPIGFSQTISQPTTVRLMLEWLGAGEGSKVLDVGSGSGWSTALLSAIVGPSGKIYAVERIPELVEFGKNNVARAGVTNAEFFQAASHFGLADHAPYDRILVSAAAEELPKELLLQLKVGGKLVIPVKSAILEITKAAEESYDTDVHSGFVFVPLIQG